MATTSTATATAERSGAAAPSVKTIEQRVGARSFERGRDYFEGGALFDVRRQGDVIKAQSHGQSGGPYRISARLSGKRILEAECNCPVGGGGYCKHVAALLLAWHEAPEEFRETPSIRELLAECEKSDLIDLIEQIVNRRPELEAWLEAALSAVAPSGGPVSTEAYRAQTIAAFGGAGPSWEGDGELIEDLESLRDIGERFHQREDYESAVAVYCGILNGIHDEYETFDDESGGVVAEANECVEALGPCFPHLTEGSESRLLAVRVLFDVLRLDITIGGVDLSVGIPEILVEQTTAEERQAVAGWIRDAMPADRDDFSSKFRRQTWGDLLLDFEDPADDEAYLRHCREFGLSGALVERLLDRGRLEEALQEIEESSDYEVMGHADRLVAYHQFELAHTLVRERYDSRESQRNNRQLREWLGRFYELRKDWRALLDLRIESFDEHPTLTAYQTIRRYAKKVKQWDAIRPEILARVPEDSPERIRIYLDEGDISQAIDLLNTHTSKKSSRNPGFRWGDTRVDLEVAKAAEKSHPEAALEIYRKEAESLIAARGRGNYHTACDHLRTIRKLFKKLDRAADWKSYLARIREENRSLRAFQDELRQARLA